MRTVSFCLLVLIVNGAHADHNWPQLHGPQGNGHSDATGLPLQWSETEHVVWKTPIHGRGWSSPVVWGNQIWLGTATPDGKQMYGVCIARDSGKVLHDILLFENPKPRFGNAFNSYASPTPAIEAGRVYLHFGSYGTACLDTKTGKTIWSRRDLPCDHWRRPGSSPLLFEDLMIIHFDGFDHQYVVALDKATGKTVWKKDRDIKYRSDNGDFKKAYGTPIVIQADGRLQLISPAANATIAHDPRTGKQLWKVRYPEHSVCIRPMYGNGLLYLNTGFGKAQLLAIRPEGTGDITAKQLVWRYAKRVPSMPSQLLIGDRIFMVHDDGVATCLDAADGQAVWQKRVEGKYTASPIYANGHIYFFSREGKTVVVKPGDKFKLVAENHLDGGFMASPAVSGNSLILRTRTHLYRIAGK